jgi:hypothetical protein
MKENHKMGRRIHNQFFWFPLYTRPKSSKAALGNRETEKEEKEKDTKDKAETLVISELLIKEFHYILKVV